MYGRGVGVLGASLTGGLIFAARVLRVRELDVEPLGFGAEDVAHLCKLFPYANYKNKFGQCRKYSVLYAHF